MRRSEALREMGIIAVASVLASCADKSDSSSPTKTAEIRSQIQKTIGSEVNLLAEPFETKVKANGGNKDSAVEEVINSLLRRINNIFPELSEKKTREIILSKPFRFSDELGPKINPDSDVRLKWAMGIEKVSVWKNGYDGII